MFEKSIQIKGALQHFDTPKIMGILNITPDSFYDGGQFQEPLAAAQQVEKMLQEGAAYIDIGAMSSRPGSDILNPDEELKRLLPVLDYLLKQFPTACFSVDTLHSKVAEVVLAKGVTLINDISAGQEDPNMMAVVSRYKATYVMMHMQGLPKNMQDHPSYENPVQELLHFFSGKIEQAKEAGIDNIIIDPGFGFGKTIAHNYEILKQLKAFQTFNLPLLVGISRKSMIYKPLGLSPEEALNGTTVLHTKALLEGAQILRVHDVKAAKECIDLVALMQ